MKSTLGKSFIAAILTGIMFVMMPVQVWAKIPSDEWMGIYMAGQKMGYTHTTVNNANYQGRDCYKIESLVRTRLVLLGTDVQQDIRTVVFTDKNYSPLYESFEMASGGRKTEVRATFSERDVQCSVITESGKSNKIVPLNGIKLIDNSMSALGSDTLKVGQKSNLHYFNPLTLSVDNLDVEVLRQETIEVKNKTYDTFVLSSVTPMGTVTSWQLEDGSMVKSVAMMNLTMLTESADEAVSGVDSSDYTPPTDLAILTSVKTNIDIPNSNKLQKLVVRISGDLDPKLVISDQRQKAKWISKNANSQIVEYTIDAGSFDPNKSSNLPITNTDFAEYLKPTQYLESDSPSIKAKAADIVGNEKSAYMAASKIRSWVSSNMKAQADIGIPRPSVDVLSKRAGVCRDYAVLFGALARAAGIPTKVVAGLVYMNGNFYYHAWNEAWCGKWVPFDATIKTNYVDATHIKLAEGDATNMFEMAKMFGNIRSEIVQFE